MGGFLIDDVVANLVQSEHRTPIWKRLKTVETPFRYRNLYFDEPVSGASSEARVGGKLVVAFVGGAQSPRM